MKMFVFNQAFIQNNIKTLTISLRIVVFFITFLAGVLIVQNPNSVNSFPVLADEFVHISLANQFLHEHKLPFSNPYLLPHTEHLNFEFGFHILLAAIFSVTGENPLNYYSYLGVLFFLINSVLLYFLVRNWGNDDVSAFSAVFLFGTITSTNAVLGNEFFLPLTLGVTFLFASLISFQKLLETGKNIHAIILILIFLVTAVTYPPTLFFVGIVLLLYLLSMEHSIPLKIGWPRSRFFWTILGCAVIGAVIFFLTLHHLSLFQKILFSADWDITHTQLSPALYSGATSLVFSLVGLFYLLFGKNVGSRIPLYWLLVSLSAIVIFYTFNFIILISFPRIFFFFLISVAIISGIGFGAAARFVINKCGRIFGTVTVTLSVLLLASGHLERSLNHEYNYPQILDEKTYASLFILRERGDGVVITDSITSIAVYPVTGMKVVGLLNSNIGGGNMSLAHTFLSGDCSEKLTALDKLQPYTTNEHGDLANLYTISNRMQNCPFLHSLNEQKPYVYEIVSQ